MPLVFDQPAGAPKRILDTITLVFHQPAGVAAGNSKKGVVWVSLFLGSRRGTGVTFGAVWVSPNDWRFCIILFYFQLVERGIGVTNWILAALDKPMDSACRDR